ncbi:MAG: Gmad2 immunoglobulin-like domain-containing protein [Patescibacteria group bacterium]|jgi:hypothetical protein|nr:Gmad2 immunoglobulin-like domain-containing protein [Patescibacteria group bacterium]MDD3778092.1 Gmad2 immunoglobulin-like domain-containing protein [Patescibacteria group bacterium]MDD3939061.1 Gmad2 immunoglobulin-like domain-containing protein [Patescibacteria group bacterium]MDD4443636.1 Gmad2 immunoglobulin-like domain-containing protein [Patescibacteria group bacterium]
MYKKYFLLIIAVLILFSALVLRVVNGPINFDNKPIYFDPPFVFDDNDDLLGADRDEHGCITSAGYVWCESKVKCLRPFEEECEVIKELPSANSQKEIVNVLVSYPLPGVSVSSPLNIKGMARGVWFFEATFPLTMETKSKEIIATSYASAEADWMTEDFVPFSATLNFETEESEGNLIVHRANPSGLKENDAYISIPLKFE